MKTAWLFIFLFGFRAVYAHNPDIASLMIYEQNGKSILLLKSSLTAFEGEVNYLFGKDSYKTPETFNQLVVQHFQENLSLVVNGNTLTFSNIQVQLGHETNLFAEINNLPNKIESFYVRNTVFKDMPNNRCELILSTTGYPQKQYILTRENKHEVTLNVAGKDWVVAETTDSFSFSQGLLIGIPSVLIASMILFRTRKQKLLASA